MATVLVFGVLLVLPEAPPRVTLAFRFAQGVFLLAFLFRDVSGASPGKRLFGLRLVQVRGGSGPLASIARNAPLLLPGWNLVEGLSVLKRDQRRPGDRIAGTGVTEA